MPVADKLLGFRPSFAMLILGAAGAWCIHGILQMMMFTVIVHLYHGPTTGPARPNLLIPGCMQVRVIRVVQSKLAAFNML